MPPQRLRFTNKLLHWLILGDFCKYFYTIYLQETFNILYCFVFNIFGFIDFALITLFSAYKMARGSKSVNFKLRSFRMMEKIVKTLKYILFHRLIKFYDNL